jgi:hypothetical protein
MSTDLTAVASRSRDSGGMTVHPIDNGLGVVARPARRDGTNSNSSGSGQPLHAAQQMDLDHPQYQRSALSNDERRAKLPLPTRQSPAVEGPGSSCPFWNWPDRAGSRMDAAWSRLAGG